MNSKYEYLLIYDDECPLCKRFKQALELMDTKGIIDFKEVADRSIYIEYPNLNQRKCEEVIHMIGEKGRIFRGGEVINELVGLFPGASKLSWLIDSESSKKATDIFYQSLNKIRGLTKKTDCPKCNKSKK